MNFNFIVNNHVAYGFGNPDLLYPLICTVELKNGFVLYGRGYIEENTFVVRKAVIANHVRIKREKV